MTKLLSLRSLVIRSGVGLVMGAALLVQPLGFLGSGPVGLLATPAGASTACPYEVTLGHSDGAVTIFGPSGDVCPNEFHGSMAGKPLDGQIVGMASTPDGSGYRLVAADGGIFSFAAPFYGSMGGKSLNQPIVGMAPTPDGKGYWMVAADGGIFAFGDAKFHGSMGGKSLNQPIVGMAVDGATGGYWMVAADGGIFAFDAPFVGSMGGKPLNAPIHFMTGTPDFGGYRMVGTDGGVFDFGDAKFYGSAAAHGTSGWDALTGTPDGGGYWLFSGLSSTAFGDATPSLIVMSGNTSAASVVGAATLDLGNGPSSTKGWFNDVTCPTSSECLAVGRVTTGGALVELSTNGGAAFESIAVPTASALNSITCVTAKVCFAVGGSSILGTDDGGEKWSLSTGGKDLTSVACQSATSCTAVGNNGAGGVASFIYTTTGSTWATATTLPPSAIANGVSCTAAACMAAGRGIYVTTDGGRVWLTKPVTGGLQSLFAIGCVPGTVTCLAVGMNSAGVATHSAKGLLVISTNNGGTWSDSTALPAASATGRQISCGVGGICALAGFGYTTSSPDLFSETVDGGTAWSMPSGPSGLKAPGGLDAGLGVSCASASDCVLVGDNGTQATAEVTANGGATWTPSSVQ